MKNGTYHALAAVHHNAKAGVYKSAGLHEKAQRHRIRAEWHSSFGADEDDALDYGWDVERAKAEWDPSTADTESSNYNVNSAYSRMLYNIRTSGAFRSGEPGSRNNPIELEPEEPSVVQERQRAGYVDRARRAHEGYLARQQLAEILRDEYDRGMRGEHSNYRRLYNPELRDRLRMDTDGFYGRYEPGLVIQAIQEKVARDRR